MEEMYVLGVDAQSRGQSSSREHGPCFYPMAEGCDLIFDPHHTATVLESPAEIQQLLATGKKKRGAKVQPASVDATLQAIADATGANREK